MLKKMILSFLAAVTLTGCMGRGALTQKVLKFNLKASEDRWNREWIFLGLNITLIYPICALLDVIVFNSVEFWSGENPINGQSPLVDVPLDEVEKMGFNNIEKAQIERICDTEAKLYLDFVNGDRATFDVVRTDMNYTVSYRGVEFYRGTIK